MAGVDAELEAYAREVSKALKPVEGGRFDLELPPDAAAYFFRREGGRPYYVIWGPGGELVDQSDPDLQVGAVRATPRTDAAKSRSRPPAARQCSSAATSPTCDARSGGCS